MISGVLPLFGLGGGVVWLWKLRLRTILRRQAELEAAVAARTAELQKAARLKDEFLATMSHEIRTPMSGIIGLTEIVLSTPLETAQAESLRLVRASAQSLLGILNDILDFSKIEAGRLELESMEFDLAGLVGEVVGVMEPGAIRKGLSLRFSVDPGVPRRLHGDPGRLRQVLLNLTGNAIKFTGQGSVVLTVRAESIDPLLLHFAVADTGIGVPSDRQELIFEPFRQGDGSISRRYGGTGLGLTICCRLVGLMGGRIQVISQPGTGSTFHFTVPMQPAPEAAPPTPLVTLAKAVEADTEPVAVRKLEILLAEDNPVNQKVACALLERRGHTVTIANDGSEAVALADERRFDVILMDVHMPHMDGYEATRRIRASGGGGVPIIAMTACTMAGDREKCLEAGMDGYTGKPVDRVALIRIVESMATGVASR